MSVRDRIYDLIEDRDDSASMYYSKAMTLVIVASLVPLCFKGTNAVFAGIEYACTAVFILDYALRWLAADKKLGKGGWSFLIYPFTPMALVDLLSILPTFFALNPALRAARVLRLFRSLRAFKLLRHSPGFNAIVGAFKRERQSLYVVLGMALAYVAVSALVIFNAEPESFGSYLDAVYWAVLSLTAEGYGDRYPTTEAGRLIAVFSSLMGIAIIALPSGIITASLVDEVHDRDNEQLE